MCFLYAFPPQVISKISVFAFFFSPFCVNSKLCSNIVLTAREYFDAFVHAVGANTLRTTFKTYLCCHVQWQIEFLKKIKPRFLNLNRPRWSDHDFYLMKFFWSSVHFLCLTWNDDNLILWLHYESRIYISRYLTLSGRSLWQSQPVSYCGSTFPRAAVIPQYSQREREKRVPAVMCLFVSDYWMDVCI